MGRRRDDTVLLTAAALGAIAGLRSMAVPALLAREFSESETDTKTLLSRFLTSGATARLLALAAGGEMIADKTSGVGDRTAPIPLIGRTVIGSLAAATLASRRRLPVLVPALIGGTAAIAATYAAFHLRRLTAERLDIPDRLLGMIEDAVVVGATRGVAGLVGEG